jgi:hypothetical protein
MKKMFNEGNQIHNFMSSSGSGSVINYGSGSGSDFLTSYGSGSGSKSQKVTVPTVPVPVPQHWLISTWTVNVFTDSSMLCTYLLYVIYRFHKHRYMLYLIVKNTFAARDRCLRPCIRRRRLYPGQWTPL